MITYDSVKAAYALEGLVDITPERVKHPDTKHFLDPYVSDIYGRNGFKMRVYYVFNPSTGIFRRRTEHIWINSYGQKCRREVAYTLNRRTTKWVYHFLNCRERNWPLQSRQKVRQVIPVHDIVKQMQLAATAIDAYRQAKRGKG